MKRKEFIRLSLLAAFGTAMNLTLPTRTPAPVAKVKKLSFKVSKELLQDATAFEHTLQPYRILAVEKIEMGWEEDDFTRNLQTVVLTYKNTIL